MRPSSHPQARRNPIERHRCFRPPPTRYPHRLQIAFEPLPQFGSLFISSAPSLSYDIFASLHGSPRSPELAGELKSEDIKSEDSCQHFGWEYCGRVRILFIGDIVGQPGRRAVKELVPRLRKRHDLDLVIANGENSAGGSGITVNTATDIFAGGVDVITTGDHVWDQKDVLGLLQHDKRVLRPINYPANTVGQGSTVFQTDGRPPVAVVNVQGRTFMANLENPFACMQAEVRRLRQITNIIVVDVHAEATSEKIAMGRMLDGQVSAVLGTHTHVQTADEQIFPGGTAFLCDAGFTGPHESVIGRDIEPIIKRFMTNLPQRFSVATGRVLLQGAIVTVDSHTGHALSIERVSLPASSPEPLAGADWEAVERVDAH